MEVVNLSKGKKYPNRDALREANDIYLDAMYQFVSKCLGKIQGTTAKELIRDALRWSSQEDIEEKIEISDIAHLVRTYWYDSFEEQFGAIDRHYEARSAIGLIVEGRNRASHRPWDLDPEFTRTQLFLIAELLGKINKPNEHREVKAIRDKLFPNDTKEHLLEVEAENAKYQKSFAEAEKHLKTAELEKAKYEKQNVKLSKQVDENTAKLDEKEKRLKKISKQLVDVKSRRDEYKKQHASALKQLEKVKAAHATCEGDSKTKSDQLDDAVGAWFTSEEHLAAMRKLFTTVTVGNREVQAVFPPFGTDSTVRILDRRGTDKRNYLLGLLEQKQPTIVYVQSEEKIDQLLTLVGPEKATVIGKRNAQTSAAEDAEILEKLRTGELVAIVSDTTFSTSILSHCVEHFVFCHLAPSSDAFFDRCQPAFTSEKDIYLHLIYNSEQDVKGLVQKYPDRKTLERLYPELRKRAETNGNFIKTEDLHSELGISKLSIETGLAIFEELQLLERNGESIKLLPPTGKKLDESEIYRRGEKLKKETADFGDFQFEHSIEQIWEKMLEKLKVDSKQILPTSNIHKMPLRISETEGEYLKDSQTQPEQSTEVVEIDNAASDETAEAHHTLKPLRANAKVTEEQVREIRSRSAAGESYSGLAKEFGLTPTGIRNIVLRNTWKHVE